jgi:hypothetical protein
VLGDVIIRDGGGDLVILQSRVSGVVDISGVKGFIAVINNESPGALGRLRVVNNDLRPLDPTSTVGLNISSNQVAADATVSGKERAGQRRRRHAFVHRQQATVPRHFQHCRSVPGTVHRPCMTGMAFPDTRSGVWVPETPHMSRDLLIFVEQSAEPVAPSDTFRVARSRLGEWPEGSGLAERAVWPVAVVVLGVRRQHGCGVSLVGDEDAVEELAADGADEAFGDRVGPRCPHWCLDDADVDCGEDGVERGGEFGVAVPVRNRKRCAVSSRSMQRLRACWASEAPVG